MGPKMAPKKIRKSEEASQDLEKCAQTIRGSILEPMWCHFRVIWASVLKAFGAYLVSFFEEIRKFHKHCSLEQPAAPNSQREGNKQQATSSEQSVIKRVQTNKEVSAGFQVSQYSSGSAGFAERKQFID